MAACCWGRGVPDERCWASSWLGVLRPEVSLRLLLGPASWVGAVKQGGGFLEDDLIGPACSPSPAVTSAQRLSHPEDTGQGEPVGHVCLLWTLFEACDSKLVLSPLRLGALSTYTALPTRAPLLLPPRVCGSDEMLHEMSL